MTFLTYRWRCVLLAAVAAAVVSAPVAAAPFAVGIEGGLQWPAFQATDTTERELAKEIVKLLKSRPALHYWTFKDIDSAQRSTAAQDLAFRFSAVELQHNVIVLRVDEFRQGRQVSPPWGDVEWLKPADVDINGLRHYLPLPAKVAVAFGAAFLRVYESAFRQELEDSAPLARWGDGNTDSLSGFEIVLPLPWEEYKELSESRFRIRCHWRREDNTVIDSVYLESQATSEQREYSEGQVRFPALVAIARCRTYPRDRTVPVNSVEREVHQLHPWEVRLAREYGSDPGRAPQLFTPCGPPS